MRSCTVGAVGDRVCAARCGSYIHIVGGGALTNHEARKLAKAILTMCDEMKEEKKKWEVSGPTLSRAKKEKK